ncbi:hypothetical protein [uncultured Succinivibrio sp.]|uniref:hypothetical protein n=1 Tax=uncultured Succinivibrio sp. TaxID=540749 RepID=UPI0025CE76DC|nr:hypothetical protein [uncultured Succinivibrio sp.]
MNINRKIKDIFLFFIFAFVSLCLTGCNGKPSADDCSSAVNEFLNQKIIGFAFPEMKLGEDIYYIPVPANHPLANGDKSFANVKYFNSYSPETYGKQFDIQEKIYKILQEKGYVKIDEAIETINPTSVFDFGGPKKYAGLKITITDKFKPFVSSMSDIVKKYTVFSLGNYAVDKVSEIGDKPDVIDGFDYYTFKYTKKIVNRPDYATDEFFALCSQLNRSLIGYKKLDDPYKVMAAKIDGKWKLRKDSFFMGHF